jgi:hypothetical protein
VPAFTNKLTINSSHGASLAVHSKGKAAHMLHDFLSFNTHLEIFFIFFSPSIPVWKTCGPSLSGQLTKNILYYGLKNFLELLPP